MGGAYDAASRHGGRKKRDRSFLNKYQKCAGAFPRGKRTRFFSCVCPFNSVVPLRPLQRLVFSVVSSCCTMESFKFCRGFLLCKSKLKTRTLAEATGQPLRSPSLTSGIACAVRMEIAMEETVAFVSNFRYLCGWSVRLRGGVPVQVDVITSLY